MSKKYVFIFIVSLPPVCWQIISLEINIQIYYIKALIIYYLCDNLSNLKQLFFDLLQKEND